MGLSLMMLLTAHEPRARSSPTASSSSGSPRSRSRRSSSSSPSRRGCAARASAAATAPGLANLTAHGGFFPNGRRRRSSPAWSIVIFSFVGRGDRHDRRRRSRDEPGARGRARPSTRSSRACSSSTCGSIVPRGLRRAVERRASSATSPFVAALDAIGIPGVGRHHERDRRHRRAVLPELRASTPRRGCCSRSPAAATRRKRCSTSTRRGVPVKAILLLGRRSASSRSIFDDDLAGQGLPVPGQLVRRGRAVRATC